MAAALAPDRPRREGPRVQLQRVDVAGLTTRIAGPADAPVTLVLLHGFGAAGDDLVELARYLGEGVRCVFPEAPLELSGLYGDARAWWLLELASLEAELRGGPVDRSGELPEGLPAARAQLTRFLDQLAARLRVADEALVLGGFSQGAMLALDVALHRARPPAGLVLLSGTLIAQAEWQPRFARLAGVPVFQSHGAHDALLPSAGADPLRDRQRGAGAAVEWHAFVGGHEIPPAIVDALGAFVRAR
jgi:phospholipase/carboxylesterase